MIKHWNLSLFAPVKITDFSLTVNKRRNTTNCHEMINELVNCFVCVLSCVCLCNPIDCSLLGSSVHGIFQARILEWVAISLSREITLPNNKSAKIYKAKAFLGNLQIKKKLMTKIKSRKLLCNLSNLESEVGNLPGPFGSKTKFPP